MSVVSTGGVEEGERTSGVAPLNGKRLVGAEWLMRRMESIVTGHHFVFSSRASAVAFTICIPYTTTKTVEEAVMLRSTVW